MPLVDVATDDGQVHDREESGAREVAAFDVAIVGKQPADSRVAGQQRLGTLWNDQGIGLSLSQKVTGARGPNHVPLCQYRMRQRFSPCNYVSFPSLAAAMATLPGSHLHRPSEAQRSGRTDALASL